MAGGDDFANQIGMSLGNPPQGKERSSDTDPCKKLKQPTGILNNSAGIALPLGRLDAVGERLDVEVVLHIDAECIRDAIADRFSSHACGLYHRTLVAVIALAEVTISQGV